MTKKILLVDDDPDFRSAVRLILEKAGYDCVEAESSTEGLKLASSENPDLILLDVMMEDISSGFRFIKALREIEDRNAESMKPILLMTSIQKRLNLRFHKRLNSYYPSLGEFIDKPVKKDVLLNRVKEIIK